MKINIVIPSEITCSTLEILSLEDSIISLLNRAAQLEEDELKDFCISMECKTHGVIDY